MTQKTTNTPLAPLTLTEWRDTVATWLGLTYDQMSTVAQTELNRIINEAHEYASKRAQHYPWGVRTFTTTLTVDDDTYDMPADFRHMIAVVETNSAGDVIRAKTTHKEEYLGAWAGSDTHPWSSSTVGIWFFDAMTGASPPVQQWKRVPSPEEAFTVEFHYRPYFSILADGGSDAFTVLPATEVATIREQIRAKWALYTKDFEQYAVYRQAREDEIAAGNINDRITTEDPFQVGLDPAFIRELS